MLNKLIPETRERWRHIMAAPLCALLIAAATACASSSGISARQLPAPDSTSSVQSGDLRIAPLDRLDIKVFGVEQMDGTYQVDPAGEIKIPLVGVIEASGYTTFELAKVLEEKLGERFLQNPQVSILVAEGEGSRLTIEGAVGKPGLYPIRGPMTLLQAIALSGGPTEGANSKSILVFRTIGGKRNAAAFDLTRIRKGQADDPQVYGNDIIVIDGSGARATYQEILRSIPLIGLFMAVS